MSPQSPTDNPLLFISHKHVDKKIADVISSFFTMHSGGGVDVFQSSSPWADAPRFGRNLNKQLRETLWHTSIFILIYTAADHDWAYCMWECGLASHPKSPDTKIILFQCAGVAPAVFSEQVNVNVRDRADIQKFTNEFLTSPDFFPGFATAITKFQPRSRAVVTAATDLFQKLEGVLPPEETDPSIDWPSYPFLQLELDFSHIEQIRKLGAKRTVSANKIIKQGCIVSATDKYCEQLFGALGFSRDLTFKQLAKSWKEKYPDSHSKWVESLCTQLRAAALSRFPTTSWEIMQGFNDTTWRAPVLTRVRNIPSRKCMQFDIYFFKFEVDSGSDAITINVPASSRKRKRAAKKPDKSVAGKKGAARRKSATARQRKSASKPKSRAKTKPAKRKGSKRLPGKRRTS